MFFGLFKTEKEKKLEFVSDVLAVAMFVDGTSTKQELEAAAKIIKELDSSPEALQIGVTRIKTLVGEFRQNRSKYYAAQDRVDEYLTKQAELKDKALAWMKSIFAADTKVVSAREELYLTRYSA